LVFSSTAQDFPLAFGQQYDQLVQDDHLTRKFITPTRIPWQSDNGIERRIEDEIKRLIKVDENL
jgi:hypothetical protein